MMKRRFTTITTILAGVLASNTAFFATQTIATQEMQPTMQATDRYMIIDLAGIPLDQAQNNMDTQLTEDSSSLSEQDESEMSMELVDQSESSVSGKKRSLTIRPSHQLMQPKLLTLTNWMSWRVVCPKLILILPVH